MGAVPQYQKVKAKAAELIEKSGHVDAGGYVSVSESEDEDTQKVRNFTGEFDFLEYIDSDGEEEEMCNIEVPETESQDLHVILQVIMSGMRKVFEVGGFDWDHVHTMVKGLGCIMCHLCCL